MLNSEENPTRFGSGSVKSFDTLYNTELEGVKTYNGFTYLPWEQCLLQFRKAANIEKLTYEFAPTEWTPAYPDGARYAIVHVTVVADNDVWKLAYPVMSGDIAIPNPNAFDIHNAQQRAFVKCVAINSGFGLKLWVEKGGKEAPSEKPDLGGQIVSLFGQLIPKMGTPDDVHRFLGTTEKSLAKIVDGEGDQQAILNKLQSYFEDELPVSEKPFIEKMEDQVKNNIRKSAEKHFSETHDQVMENVSAVLEEAKPEKPVFKSPFD